MTSQSDLEHEAAWQRELELRAEHRQRWRREWFQSAVVLAAYGGTVGIAWWHFSTTGLGVAVVCWWIAIVTFNSLTGRGTC